MVTVVLLARLLLWVMLDALLLQMCLVRLLVDFAEQVVVRAVAAVLLMHQHAAELHVAVGACEEPQLTCQVHLHVCWVAGGVLQEPAAGTAGTVQTHVGATGQEPGAPPAPVAQQEKVHNT